jgi:hypothetical protein
MTIKEKIELKIYSLKEERRELSFLLKQLQKNDYHFEYSRVARDMDWINKQIQFLDEELIQEYYGN